MKLQNLAKPKLLQNARPAKPDAVKAKSDSAQPLPSDVAEINGSLVSKEFSPSPASVSKSKQLQASLGANLSSNLPATIAGPLASSFQAGFVGGYITPSQIRERCQELAKEFPDLVDMVDTGIRTQGYDGKNEELRGPAELFYLRIGPKTADRDQKTGVFQYAAPHARERINPMSMMELTEQLLRNYDPSSADEEVKKNTELLDGLDIFIAINTNPDGHNFAAFDDPMWRKNRAHLADGEVGVDVNRNYPYEWEETPQLSAQTYSGTGPGSEPETQALLAVTAKHSNIFFVVDWHSYGEEIRRPLNTQADDKLYDQMHGRVQKSMQAVAGNKYETVVSQVTKGTSDDHFYIQNGIISTVMETGKDFTPPEAEALVVMRESVAGAREYLNFALDFEKGQL